VCRQNILIRPFPRQVLRHELMAGMKAGSWTAREAQIARADPGASQCARREGIYSIAKAMLFQ
jgi:hypothetical protein